jgi:anti-repressor protein
MKADIQIFKNSQFGEVRVTEIDGNPHFVAKDVARALGYSENTNVATATSFVPDEWKGVFQINTPYGNQEVTFVTEEGLYFWLGRCDKPAAIPYQKWIAGEVLPSIRKHGMYATADTVEKMLSDPDTMIKTLNVLKEERQKRLEAESTIKSQAPKVLFADAVATSDKSILIAELSKIITQNGVEIGQNRLFEWLRQNGYLCSKGEYYNQPTQKAMELGLFEIKKTSITKPDGSVLVTCTTKVTGKGQIYFINKFLKKAA